jgi:hypothetical protein
VHSSTIRAAERNVHRPNAGKATVAGRLSAAFAAEHFRY